MEKNPSLQHSIDNCRVCIDQCNACIRYCNGKPGLEYCAKICAACVRACEHFILISREPFIDIEKEGEVCAEACSNCSIECAKHIGVTFTNCIKACKDCEEACRSIIVDFNI